MKDRPASLDFHGAPASSLESIHTCLSETLSAFGIAAPSKETYGAS